MAHRVRQEAMRQGLFVKEGKNAPHRSDYGEMRMAEYSGKRARDASSFSKGKEKWKLLGSLVKS